MNVRALRTRVRPLFSKQLRGELGRAATQIRTTNLKTRTRTPPHQRGRFTSMTVTAHRSEDPELAEVHRPLQRFEQCRIFVHGSWADDTRTPFSDLDNLILVDDSRLEAKDCHRLSVALARVDLNMMRLDPLQHHGNWIILESDLEGLDESYLPLRVVEGALCLKGSPEVRARVSLASSSERMRRNVVSLAEALRVFSEPRAMNLWNAKHLVSGLSLMPAYLHQVHGRRISKRDALHADAVNAVLSGTAGQAIAWATQARKHWGRQLEQADFGEFAGKAAKLRSGPAIRKFAKRNSPKPTGGFVESLPTPEIAALISESLAHASS